MLTDMKALSVEELVVSKAFFVFVPLMLRGDDLEFSNGEPSKESCKSFCKCQYLIRVP